MGKRDIKHNAMHLQFMGKHKHMSTQIQIYPHAKNKRLKFPASSHIPLWIKIVNILLFR